MQYVSDTSVIPDDHCWELHGSLYFGHLGFAFAHILASRLLLLELLGFRGYTSTEQSSESFNWMLFLSENRIPYSLLLISHSLT